MFPSVSKGARKLAALHLAAEAGEFFFSQARSCVNKNSTLK